MKNPFKLEEKELDYIPDCIHQAINDGVGLPGKIKDDIDIDRINVTVVYTIEKRDGAGTLTNRKICYRVRAYESYLSAGTITTSDEYTMYPIPTYQFDWLDVEKE